MPEITEVDRVAAAEAHLHRGMPRTEADRMRRGEADDHWLPEAFAAHREATEAAIVAWLRTPPVGLYECAELADAIASGAHRSKE